MDALTDESLKDLTNKKILPPNSNFINRNQMNETKYLQDKLHAGEVATYLQPIFSNKNNEVSYYECLLRIKENGELISAGRYIQSAEKSGDIIDIELQSIEIILNCIMDYELQPSIYKINGDTNYSINISGLSSGDEYFSDYLIGAIKEYNLAHRLIIELTESSASNNIENSQKLLENLKDMGCKLAIDDFGSGHCNMIYLSLFEFDILKIDGHFIKDIHQNYTHEKIVKNIIRLCSDLGMQPVAEFVSNSIIMENLAYFGIDLMQGYYIDEIVQKMSVDKNIIR